MAFVYEYHSDVTSRIWISNILRSSEESENQLTKVQRTVEVLKCRINRGCRQGGTGGEEEGGGGFWDNIVLPLLANIQSPPPPPQLSFCLQPCKHAIHLLPGFFCSLLGGAVAAVLRGMVPVMSE